jgi:hypothetical protein
VGPSLAAVAATAVGTGVPARVEAVGTAKVAADGESRKAVVTATVEADG